MDAMTLRSWTFRPKYFVPECCVYDIVNACTVTSQRLNFKIEMSRAVKPRDGKSRDGKFRDRESRDGILSFAHLHPARRYNFRDLPKWFML
jgi:hypothetical protein